MRRLAILVPLVVLMAGCGSSSSSTTTSTSTRGSTSSSAASPPSTGTSTPSTTSSSGLTLAETEFKITPKTPTFASTGKVTITVKNTGKIVHALAIQTPNGVIKTGTIAPGATATLTVDLSKAGSYTFYCPIDHHRELGMVGTLTVGGGGASSGGAPAAGSGTSRSTSSSPSGGAPAY